MLKPLVLLVDDDDLMREFMDSGLRDDGYTVIAAATAAEFKSALEKVSPDIAIIDLVLPDGDGFSLVKALRARTNAPVIIVSAKNELQDKIAGLELGADDYVTKPILIEELRARVKAQLRRHQSAKKEEAGEQSRKSDAERLAFGVWVLDRPQMQAFDAEGHAAGLSVNEFRLLEALVLSCNRVLSREQLLKQSRSDDGDVTDRAIDVQISRIRRKLRDTPGPDELIRAVRGVGYMCAVDATAL